MKTSSMSQSEVLAWLTSNHPSLVPFAEVDRAWVWLSTGDMLAPIHFKGVGPGPWIKTKFGQRCECGECKARASVRESLHGVGFQYARQQHPLPSGKNGNWGNNCGKPTPKRFNKSARKGRFTSVREAVATSNAQNSPSAQPQPVYGQHDEAIETLKQQQQVNDDMGLL